MEFKVIAIVYLALRTISPASRDRAIRSKVDALRLSSMQSKILDIYQLTLY